MESLEIQIQIRNLLFFCSAERTTVSFIDFRKAVLSDIENGFFMHSGLKKISWTQLMIFQERAEWVNSIIQQLWTNIGHFTKKIIHQSGL